jgi:hypothetical protein
MESGRMLRANLFPYLKVGAIQLILPECYLPYLKVGAVQ